MFKLLQNSVYVKLNLAELSLDYCISVTKAVALFQDNFHANEFLISISFNQLVTGSDCNYYFKKSRLDQKFGGRNEFREN